MNPSSQSGQPNTPAGSNSPQPVDYSQPVAYDRDGNPLYAHPPAAHQSYQQGPQVVHITRPSDPVDQPISPEAMRRWEASQKKYPNLNLSKGEYIISAVKRHPIGMIQIWLVVVVLMVAFGALFGMLFLGGDVLSALGGPEEAQTGATLLLMVLFFLFVMGGMAATYIYNNNRFYLTNESVIQEIQTTLFSKHEQTVSLSNIEDASYRQNGILPMILNYGTIRLSTEGDETTYRFSYVANPKKHIAVLNNAVEAFKNGRPVDLPHQDQPS